jgi:hypothetical protein
MSMWRAGAVLIAMVVAAMASSARAWMPTLLKPDEVRFSTLVARAADITLVRVVAATPINLGREPGLEDATTTFSVQTIERIKGNAPADFTLPGVTMVAETHPDFKNFVTASHAGVGHFWTHFDTPVGPFPWGFAVGSEFLIFRNSDGTPFHAYGRGVELIPSRDDVWLDSVRTLARNPNLKFARKGQLIAFMTSARSITKVECNQLRPAMKGIWGIPAKLDEGWDTPLDGPSRCRVDGRWLVIKPSDENFGALWLPVERMHDIVDFSAFLSGTQRTLGSLWYSQIEFEGPRRWTLAEIERSLQSYKARQVH